MRVTDHFAILLVVAAAACTDVNVGDDAGAVDGGFVDPGAPDCAGSTAGDQVFLSSAIAIANFAAQIHDAPYERVQIGSDAEVLDLSPLEGLTIAAETLSFESLQPLDNIEAAADAFAVTLLLFVAGQTPPAIEFPRVTSLCRLNVGAVALESISLPSLTVVNEVNVGGNEELLCTIDLGVAAPPSGLCENERVCDGSPVITPACP